MKKLGFTFLFLVTALSMLAVFVGVQDVEKKPLLGRSKPHVYEKKDSSIENIHITLMYFIPKDALNKKDTSWQAVTEKHIKSLINFHTVQFEGASKITYDFFPEIITGEKTTSEYESVLGYDDNDSLAPIKDEVSRRMFTVNGDLHSFHKPKAKDVSRRDVYLLIFEGKGAAGNDDFALVSRAYLTDAMYKDFGSTFLAHEFYHTLGLPDNYQISTYVYKDNEQVSVSLLTKKDIMGQVNIPLPYTYIDVESLKKMGL
jgi:hypothetical protein